MASNERGHYGSRPHVTHVGAESRPSEPSGPSITPWLLGGVGLAVVGLVVFGSQVIKQPRLSAHEREVRAWGTEFPGLPWYMDQVKDARQLDTWERARDHWERTH
jgi:hypothetical protein